MRSSRIEALDGWRGLAIAALLLGHFLPYWRINLGRTGAELFFALSGSLMGWILFQRQMKLGELGPRRFARIVPSMWLSRPPPWSSLWLAANHRWARCLTPWPG